MGPGFLAWGDAAYLTPLDKTDKLLRQIKNLDKSGPARDHHKIGVIYVGPGQKVLCKKSKKKCIFFSFSLSCLRLCKTKEAILLNERGSEAFEAFVDGLGMPVDLRVHTGYKGNMREDQFEAERIPYFAASTYDALFHAVTRMKVTDQAGLTEEQIVHRRWVHVGNDAVHLVWCEDTKDYTTDLLPTQVDLIDLPQFCLSRRLATIYFLHILSALSFVFLFFPFPFLASSCWCVHITVGLVDQTEYVANFFAVWRRVYCDISHIWWARVSHPNSVKERRTAGFGAAV